MNKPIAKSELPPCCRAAGEANFLKRFPLQLGAEDPLRDHLLAIAKKWGPITKFATQGVYFRTVSREFVKDEARPYFNAEMRTLHCPQGHAFQFALLGKRVYYLAWRIHMICLSFFQKQEQEGARTYFSGPDDWPGPEEVEQLKLAMRVYRNDSFLSNEGFEDLYKWAREAPDKLAPQHLAVAELALLFIFLHEVHHGMETFYEEDLEKRPKVQAAVELEGLGRKQRDNWEREIQADGNALYMLTCSAAYAVKERYSIDNEEARAIASSLVGQASSLVLHSLEFIERQTHGKIDVEKAKSMPAFLTHPPCDLRRSMLSYVSYQLVTGMPHQMLFQGHNPTEWQQVAQDCAPQIGIRERLYAAAEA